MPTDHRAALAAIKRFDQLIAFLRDEMDWPIVSDDFEELTFEYSAEELGIDAGNAAKIQEIKRLRPLAANQPWGVFFVKFEPKRLPVVALRSILGRVALKKRASANDAERPAWAMEDLLFISDYGEGDARRISFAHFAAPAGSSKLPTLKVVDWDDKDTGLHLDHVAHKLTGGLAWPFDEDDADTWREQWRAAFTLGHREVINTAQQLSIRLAALARAIRDRIHAALEIETENGRITRLMKAFREALVHDLDADGFADMVAQTIAYGLLSARIADPQQGTADDLAGHMRTNPLLRDLMAAFLRVGDTLTGAEIDYDELGVAEVVDLLDDPSRTNMEAVVRDFGDRNPREDPVIHFYESFLKEYDKQKKVERGVFYTPRPVVSYIVRSVDALLRSEFGLKEGLADTATWGEMAERREGLSIPAGISPNQDFVQILDPATGTGTFLVEIIDLIHRTLREKWQAKGHGEKQVELLWNEYVPKHLLPRLHGYELLMAPYAIAHLKIGLKLYETGYRFGTEERARVYLTNALEPAHGSFQTSFDFAIPALAHEAQAVNKVKGRERFTVVIGNPPYSGHSANKNAWIAGLIDDYKQGFPELKKPAQAKWLSDDYVKFIRLAQSEHQRAGAGVIGLITNHSYLNNPTFRGMRRRLMETFDRIHVVDLHGNSKKKERAPDGGKDENVFDIQQGVAIGLFTSCVLNRELAQVLHADLWGERDATSKGGNGKYDWLVARSILSTGWEELSPTAPLHLFAPRDEVLSDEYDAAWPIPAIFSVNGDPAPGIVTTHDQFAISWSPDEAEIKIERLLATETETEARTIWRLCSQNQWQYDRAKRELSDGFWRERVQQILYRPFDLRTTVFDRNVAVHRRERVMRHLLTGGENLGLCIGRAGHVIGSDSWDVGFVSKHISDFNLFRRGGNCLFPLYTYPSETLPKATSPRVPNLDSKFTQAFAAGIGFSFIPDGTSDLTTTFGPEDIFHYLYAILHSPEYRRRYADFLKSDFPRIPLPSGRALLVDLIPPGVRLVSLHLAEAESADARLTFPVPGSNQVDKLRYTPPKNGQPGRVWINRAQYFDGVDPNTYAFAIGGYRPAEKWLKDRKGRALAENDIAHYRKIVAALAETRRRMAEIDDIIEAHGGWPAAFQPGKSDSAAPEIIPFRPRTVEPEPADRYVTCVPLVPLQAAAGAFSDPQTIDEADDFDWAAIDTGHRLRPGMFAAQVVGKSMEPAIPDGAWCLFRAPVEGTRQGKTVLVRLRDGIDPETGQRFTVKRYASVKAQADDTWRHTRITLSPVNPDFASIVLTPDGESDLEVIAELIEVLQGDP